MSTQEEREPIAQIEERLRRLKVPETVIAKHVEQLERLRQPGNRPVRFATGWGPVNDTNLEVAIEGAGASIPSETGIRPELRLRNVAAQARIVSVARIRLDS